MQLRKLLLAMPLVAGVTGIDAVAVSVDFGLAREKAPAQHTTRTRSDSHVQTYLRHEVYMLPARRPGSMPLRFEVDAAGGALCIRWL